MLNSIFSQSIDQPILNQPLDGRFQVSKILTSQFCRQIYLAQDLYRPEQPDCIVYHLQALPDRSNFEDAVQVLLMREVDLLAELGNHAQIPTVLACFENEAGFFVVQEAIPGVPLSQELQKQPWSAKQVIQFLEEILELLSFVHKYGSIHGNLTPNAVIRRDDGRLCLVDFGNIFQIQESLIAASGQSVPYSEAAQQGYQPLEQLQGLPCAASDIYAIGIISIQALTGIQPTQLKIDLEARQIAWRDQYQAESAVEQRLVEILDTMVQWDLTQRYKTVTEVLTELQAVSPVLSSPAPVVTIAATVVKDAIAPIFSSPISFNPTEAKPFALSAEARPEYRQNPNDLDVRQPDDRFPVQRLLFSTLSRPSVLVGAGGTVATLVLAGIGWSLLSSVGWTIKGNEIWAQFHKSQPDANSEGHSFSDVSAQWQKNWQAGADTYRQAEDAFNLGKWLEANRLSQRMPPIPYWQDRGKTLSRLAIAHAETDANQLLQSAYTYAYDRNFTAALRELKQIPQETSVAEVAQRKIQEYSEKQVVRAWFDLQRAYDRANVQDFTQALTYLWQIPLGTPAYETAQEKIVEYTQKQELYVKSLLESANTQAQQNDLQAALTSLEKAPKGTSLDPQVEASVAQYTQQLNQQADQQLQAATLQAETGGNTASVVAALEKVPMGTSAYAQARDKIAEYTKQQPSPVSQPVAQQTIATSRNLNPGSQLREAI